MKIFFKSFILVTFVATFSSCISTSDLIKQDNFKPSDFSLDQFNGNYINLDTITKGLTIWNSLHDCKSFKNDTIRTTNNSIVNLNFDNKNKLTVTLKENNIILNTIILKAKRQGDYVSIHRNLFLIPIPFFWTRYHEAKVILSNDSTGNLHLNYARSQFIWTLMAGSVDQNFNQKHIKANK